MAGLNLARLAQMKKDAEKESASAPVPSPAKAAVSTSLAELESLSSAVATAVANKAPTESAGTINFNQVSSQITDLAAAIKAAHPQMPVLLQEIWTTLNKYPECVTILTEDEMEVIVSGLEKQTSIDLAAITIKSATKSGGKKTPVTAALLGF